MTYYKVDLHTHSKLSPDGSIDEKDYQKILTTGALDALAITDHNTIDYALFCQKKLGKQIIIGEEISTMQGHVIGLFLTKPIEKKLDVLTTAKLIKEQGGIVYVPHAYDFFRSGIGAKQLNKIIQVIDIVEVFNGRVVLPIFNTQAENFAKKNKLARAFGSDAHFANALGKGYMLLTQLPSINKHLYQNVRISGRYNPFFGYFAPKYNRLQKLFHI